MIEIILPLPDMRLSHNRSHGSFYGVVSGYKKKQRETAMMITLNTIGNNKPFMPGVELELKIEVYWNNKRRVDLSNILDAAKSQIDGVFLALELDDYCLDDVRIVRKPSDKENPRVVYYIYEIKS